MTSPHRVKHGPLTERQFEIVRLLAAGWKPSLIRRELGIQKEPYRNDIDTACYRLYVEKAEEAALVYRMNFGEVKDD